MVWLPGLVVTGDVGQSSVVIYGLVIVYWYIQVLIPPLAREKLNSSGKAKFLDLYGLGGWSIFLLSQLYLEIFLTFLLLCHHGDYLAREQLHRRFKILG